MKPLYDIPEARNHSFTIYHLHDKEKFKMTKIVYNSYLYYKSAMYWLEVFFDDFDVIQKAKFLPDNNTLQLIGYDICMSISTNNIKIIHQCNQTKCNILSAEFYAMAHGFNVEK